MEKKKPAKRTAEGNQKMNFEKALGELENIAIALENGELGLEESINQFEKGMKLAKFCRDKLDEAERKIEILQKGDRGDTEKKAVKVKENSGEIEDDEELQGSLL